MDSHVALCEKLKREGNQSNTKRLVMEIDEAEKNFMSLCEPLAFGDKARNRKELFRFMSAADYSDGWMEVKTSKGRLVGGFSSFYICRAGHEFSKCNSLILNKDWVREPQDMMASRQKRKCCCCGTGYLREFGMVVEIRWVGWSVAGPRPLHGRRR